VIEVKDFEICGCDAMVEIKPYYFKGFDPSTLKVYMHKRKGLEREEYELLLISTTGLLLMELF